MCVCAWGEGVESRCVQCLIPKQIFESAWEEKVEGGGGEDRRDWFGTIIGLPLTMQLLGWSGLCMIMLVDNN